MDTLVFLARAVWLLAIAYFLGAIPTGYLVVKILTGKDVRFIESGRTGATNTFRAAGFPAGLFTAIFDLLKGASTVWLAKFVFPTTPWMHILAPLMAILGHNYPIFTVERDDNGRLRLWGGAGGAPCAGGALGLWWPSIFIIVPVGWVLWFFVGYASVATMSVPLIIAGIMAVRAWMGQGPWVYALYGLLAEGLILWALRPNIRRLLQGTERAVGLRAWLRKRREQQALASEG